MPLLQQDALGSFAGSVDVLGLDQDRTRSALYCFGVVGIAILVLVSAINVWFESGALVGITLGTAVVVAGCLVDLRRSGRTRPIIHVYGLLMVMLSFALVHSGGVRGNGHLWLFIFPPVCYFLMGLRYGSAYFLVMLATVAVVLFSPYFKATGYPYDGAFGVRYLIALVGVAGISFWYEVIRQRMHQALLASFQAAEERGRHDELTGMLNRRGGMTMLNHYRHVCDRRGEPCTVMMVDLDHFKQVNDTYGHSVGDEVLSGASQMLRAAMRAQDVGIRWGGEEFLFLLPDTQIEGARVVAVNVLEQLRAQGLPSSVGKLDLTCSIGLAQRQGEEALEQTIARADNLLYEAKRLGRNRYEG